MMTSVPWDWPTVSTQLHREATLLKILHSKLLYCTARFQVPSILGGKTGIWFWFSNSGFDMCPFVGKILSCTFVRFFSPCKLYLGIRINVADSGILDMSIIE
jgi:hypothetical protein